MLIFKVNKIITVINTNNVHHKPNINGFTIIEDRGNMVYVNEAMEIAGLVMRKFINPEYPYEVSKEVLLEYRNTTVGIILSRNELIAVTIADNGVITPKSQTINDEGYFLVTSSETLGLYLQGALSYLMIGFEENVNKEMEKGNDINDASSMVECNIVQIIIGLYSEKALSDPIGVTMMDLRDGDKCSIMELFNNGFSFDIFKFTKGVSSYVEVRKKYIESLKKLKETKDENTENQKPRRARRVPTRRREG